MILQLTPHHLLLFSASLLTIFLTIAVLPKKLSVSAFPLIGVLIAAMLWSFGAAVESVMITQPEKIFWLNLSQSGEILLPWMWFIFIRKFVQKEKQADTKALLIYSILPLLFVLLLWVDPYHGLFWGKLNYQPGMPTNHMPGLIGIIGITSLIYGNLIALICLSVLIQALIRLRGQPRMQIIILLLCTLVPWVAHLSSLFFPTSFGSRESSLYLFNLSSILFALGLFRYRLLNSIPIPFDAILDGMQDGILILSHENEIIHANPSAAAILGIPVENLLKQSARQVLESHPDLNNQFLNITENSLERISLDTGSGTNFFETHAQLLRDRYGFPVGKMVILHNISNRVHFESISQESRLMLKQSEEKYRSLVENINELIFTVDLSRTITYASPIVERYTGQFPEEVEGKNYLDFVHPDDRSLLEQSWECSLNGQMESLEYRILHKNGNVHYVRTSIRPILINGVPAGVQGVLTDITERKRAEDALKRRASQLSILNDIGEQIASVIELDRVLDSATRLIQEHFSYYHVAIFTPDPSSSELVLRTTSGAFAQVIPEKHRLKPGQGMVGWAAAHKTMLLTNDVSKEPRYTKLFPDELITRSELAVPILIGEEMAGVLDVQSPRENVFDENDVLVVKTVADQIAIAIENARLYEEVRQQLKERERKENILRIQRDLLVRLSAAISLEEMLRVAVDSLRMELNASKVSISLSNREDNSLHPVVMGEPPPGNTSAPAPLESTIIGWVTRCAQPALMTDINQEPRAASGSPDTVSLMCAPLISNKKVIGVINLESSCYKAFSQDDLRLLTTLTNSLVVLIERSRLFEEVEKARAELENRAAELEDANASLRQMDRIKNQFLANMSHELRTPLNSIIGFSELMIDEITGPMTQDQAECVKDIHASGKHLLALINDLLDFSKIEAGRMVLEPTHVDVAKLFDELRISVAPLIEKKSQELIFRKDGNMPPLTADPLRIKQVFINLISNANKFTPEQGVIIVDCKASEPDQLLFSVSDTGIGIRPEDQEFIFEEFRQVDGSMTREVPGSGLGLAISKRIIELHGGKIWVESELGKGATFFVSVPVDFDFYSLERNSPHDII